MARKLELKKTNGFDPDRVKGFVADIEAEFDNLASEKDAYMERAKVIRGRIDDIYKTAKALGVPRGPLKAVIKERELERRLEAIPESFAESEEREKYNLIMDALGDFASTPLGEAAASPPENVTSLADAVTTNVARLKRGIKKHGDSADDLPAGTA
ncbi:MAG: hypothetical protein L0Y60_04295 [Beijerinckiaceae bacterium]|nr:hypothetical protein [Beijerinckiaceae bacterium]